MTELYEVAGKPLEVTVGGRRLKLASPRIGDLYGELERLVVQREIDAAVQAAERLGLAAGEKAEFVRRAIRDRPRGLELQKLVWEEAGTPEGVGHVLFCAARAAGVEISLEETLKLAMADPDGALAAVDLILPVATKGGKKKRSSGRTSSR